jgi:hypothetical protein
LEARLFYQQSQIEVDKSLDEPKHTKSADKHYRAYR